MLSRTAIRLATVTTRNALASPATACTRSLSVLLRSSALGGRSVVDATGVSVLRSRLPGVPAVVPSAIRSMASTAARAKVVEEEEEDEHIPSVLESTPEAATIEDAAPSRLPFSSLKGSVSHDTLTALTVRPFKFTEMSEVQERVLGLMPGLIGGVRTEKYTEEGEEALPSDKQDLLVKAKTGTGKTVAFLVPGIEARKRKLEKEVVVAADGTKYEPHERGRVARDYSRSAVGTLVISPTRELATQIAVEAEKLVTHHKEYTVQLLVGGESRRAQIRNWKKGRLDVVVATPGRLRDLLEDVTEDGDMIRQALAQTNLLVLDEADTLLEMGFSADLNAIIGKLPKARQTFLFSATVSPAIRDIAKKSLDRNHRVIDCVPANESNTHMHIPQFATVLPSARDQLPHVLRLIAHDQLLNPGASKCIVFLPTTKMTQLYATFLRELQDTLPISRKTHVYEIHSKLEQRRRSRASDSFRQDKGGASVLVTSDVSARGVDYPGVTRVIQVNIPGSSEQYIHRVGRTGRAGSTTGRGDLVLLPWEANWLKRELKGVPIQSTSVEKVQEDINSMAPEFDADPSAYAVARGFKPISDGVDGRHGGNHERRGGFLARKPHAVKIPPFAPRHESMSQTVDDLVSSLDSEAVNEVFISSLGYYMSKTDALGISSMNVVKCLQDWAVEAGGLPEPPHVSAGFLAKLGVRNDRPPRNNGRASSFGKRGDSSFSPRNDRSDRSGGDRRRSFESSDRPGGSRSSYGGRSSSFGDRSSGTSSYGETSYGARRDGPPRRTFGDRY